MNGSKTKIMKSEKRSYSISDTDTFTLDLCLQVHFGSTVCQKVGINFVICLVQVQLAQDHSGTCLFVYDSQSRTAPVALNTFIIIFINEADNIPAKGIPSSCLPIQPGFKEPEPGFN